MNQQEPSASERVGWRCAVTMSALVALAMTLGILNAPATEHPVAIARRVSVAWSLAFLGLLLVRRNKPSTRLVGLAFALVPLPLLPVFWLVLGERALRGLPFEAFLRQEIVCIVYALATPPSSTISLGVIAAFTLDALVLLWWLGPHVHQVSAQPWQPWTILLYGACAGAIALFRARSQRREVAMIVQLERAATMKRLVRADLALRDLINTPLQTLRIGLSLLVARCPGQRELTDAMGHAVDRLHELNHVLSTDAFEIDCAPESESFDPVRVLETIRAKGSE